MGAEQPSVKTVFIFAIFFFFFLAEVGQRAYSEYTLRRDWEEIPIQFGTHQCGIEIFAVEKRQMYRIS